LLTRPPPDLIRPRRQARRGEVVLCQMLREVARDEERVRLEEKTEEHEDVQPQGEVEGESSARRGHARGPHGSERGVIVEICCAVGRGK
jgi:hypothetical protein